MASREELREQKEKTSQALIQSALELCAEEGYASLSLRSVARKAGIAPTSFYRHFREIDELGVAMVDQAKELLDDCLEQAREKMKFPAVKQKDAAPHLLESLERITRPLADTFFEFFSKNSQLLHLFFQEQTGSSKTMRVAISDAIDQLNGALENTLKRLTKTSGYGFDDTGLIAEAMMTIVSHSGLEMMTFREDDPVDIADRAIQKMNLLLLGALMKDMPA
jgi:TetR/AcrR family transcriptional regulator, fatty acid biosynthesis regulator